jgi:hypothetical protein
MKGPQPRYKNAQQNESTNCSQEHHLFSQNQQAVPAQHSHGQVWRQGKAELPWNPGHLLDNKVSQFDAPRSIEIVDDCVSDIGQSSQGSFPSEIMQMRVMIAAKKQSVLPQNCLH